MADKWAKYAVSVAPDTVSAAPADVSNPLPVAVAPNPEIRRSWQRGALNMIPPASAGLAALATGGASIPITLSAAYLGGAAGEAARQAASTGLGMREPAPFSGQALGRISQTGLEQSALEGVGLLAAGAARGTARNFMRTALRPSVGIQSAAGANRTMAAREMYPEGERIWETAIKERIPVGGRPGEMGSDKIATKIEAVSNRLNLMLADAEKHGIRYTAQDVVGPIAELRAQLSKEAVPIQKLDQLDRMLKQFIGSRRQPPVLGRMGKMKPITPAELNDLKRVWQDAAQQIYKARERGAVVGPRQELSGRFSGAVATGARQRLSGDIPGYDRTNAELQRMMQLRDAVRSAERRNPPMLSPLYGPLGPVIQAVRGPESMSRAALMLSGRPGQIGLRQFPRALQYAMSDPGFEQSTVDPAQVEAFFAEYGY